jgi:protoporphyrinogen oxidase
MSEPITILGAGLSGISTAYHTGHARCRVFEAKPYAGGHIFSHRSDGYTWDEGPHVSFTKHQYVKDLFAKSLDGDLLEFKVFPTNYFKGHWIPHPAQSNLHAVPEPLRSQCLNDFLQTRDKLDENYQPENYAQWLRAAFGKTFAETFSFPYTEKYWTVPAERLETDWVGSRIFYPQVEQVVEGSKASLPSSTHYITSIRYPAKGGYHSFSSLMEKGMNLTTGKEVTVVDLSTRTISFKDGSRHMYQKLVSTLPLPDLIRYCHAPGNVLDAAEKLACSQLLLLNFEVAHPATRTEQWLYVYDKEKYSTRINFTELLSPSNAPAGRSGIQVEVYFSKFKPLLENIGTVAEQVAAELLEMGLVKNPESIEKVNTQWIPYANVIFDHQYKNALDTIFDWLSYHGLVREEDELSPMTDWDTKMKVHQNLGDLILAGRFGQWKYYWTDDCVLRGKWIGDLLSLKEHY